jgi:hypothetical protein
MENNWVFINKLPNSGQRCLVTDGDTIFIATYISESDNSNIWIFSGLTESDSKSFKIQYWQSIPSLPKKIVSYEEPSSVEGK